MLDNDDTDFFGLSLFNNVMLEHLNWPTQYSGIFMVSFVLYDEQF